MPGAHSAMMKCGAVPQLPLVALTTTPQNAGYAYTPSLQ